MRCDKRTFLAVVALVRLNWRERIHHNVKFDITKRVAVTIIYLSTGGTIDSAATVMGMSKTSAVVYICQVLSVLTKMAKEEITMPSTQTEIKKVTDGFERIAGFPDVIGAVDGSSMRFRRPAKHEGCFVESVGSAQISVPSGIHLLGDAGYKIFRHLLTPFDEEEASSSVQKRRYNYKLSQTRITVERAFGILKNRYRILLGKISQKYPARVTNVITATRW
ncbi:DDE superfamily endonuclease [Phytophthora infestans]|uniref:DDE superfamily endonuclease n=1 Tax=Phytophthora infestans TaxID=4787 RepID=A0A8S9U4N7_PHYIN|nr:DDE superfamily endonuclease [Phytophthora infestans]